MIQKQSFKLFDIKTRYKVDHAELDLVFRAYDRNLRRYFYVVVTAPSVPRAQYIWSSMAQEELDTMLQEAREMLIW